MSGDTLYRAVATVEKADFDEQIILIDSATELMFTLEGIAVDVWRLLEEGPTSVEGALSCVNDIYEVPADIVSADVRGLIDALLLDGLIAVAEAS